jgi:hypothetical protein
MVVLSSLRLMEAVVGVLLVIIMASEAVAEAAEALVV